MWQWKKNGIPFDHTIGRIFARGSVLSGRQLLNTDAGFYMLTATNSIGSTNITLKVVIEHSARVSLSDVMRKKYFANLFVILSVGKLQNQNK